MAVRDALAALFGRDVPQRVDYLGPVFQKMVLGLTPEELYRTQPHLRTVLGFVARNVAHLGLKAYGRAADGGRVRQRDSVLARLLRQPNPSMTGFELLETLASDLGLYDIAYWVVGEDGDAPSGWFIRPIPPSWVVKSSGGDFFSAGKYVVQNPDGSRVEIDAKHMIVFHGWNPGMPKKGASPIETLKQVLAEQVQAWSYREQIWQRGGRVGAYLTRPKEAAWSDSARERFARDWKERWTGPDGAKAGGTPILEDGMELKRLGFSAREDEWVEAAKLALSTVAGVYYVNPVMVGVLDNANFSNAREFRKSLYSETLGPTLARIEDRINTFLVPLVTGGTDEYVEFNIEEKLQGSFEEQAKILSSAVGAPWMTRDEARALRNMPSIEGGDVLVTPLNVVEGGLASPRDTAPKTSGAARMLAELAATHPELATDIGELRQVRALPSKATPERVRSKAPEGAVEDAEGVMLGFFARQAEVVLAKVNGQKDAEWWNAERWDRELAADLLVVVLGITKAAATAALTSAGMGEGDYDAGRAQPFITAAIESRARWVNETTRKQIEAILAGEGPEGVSDPAHAFDVAKSSRAAAIAVTLATTFAAFATVEAARQNNSGDAAKTWLTTSSNPRPEHAAMSGTTVPIDDPFPNGAKWPGDPALGPDGVAGCECIVDVTF